MRHHHSGGPGRRFHTSEDQADRRFGGRHRRHHGGRPFDYGELRLLTLAMIAEQPAHGYELMKSIEERMAGTYTPSPGVMYPTLSWLEDSGYAVVEVAEGGRKRYQATDEGRAFLAANRAALDDLTARIQPAGGGRYDGVPAPLVRGMENLKLALRLRLQRGPLDQATGEAIAAALDAAALAVERS
jgi:DNA-binding PadR family transcriptional regulator